MREQSHLTIKDTINLGSYYTPSNLVEIVYQMIDRNVHNWKSFKIVDTSCGYGNFLIYPNSIGSDIDKVAVAKAKKFAPASSIYCGNSLISVGRKNFELSNTDKIIIVGNPPYNDRTSIIRNNIKNTMFEIDEDLKHRDMGVSFLLSYNKLEANYICVLHPLSYLIKKANFEGLKSFNKNYKLIDNIIISSGEFNATSKTTQFPIIIALYKRDEEGMSYEFIRKYKFKTKSGASFHLDMFDKLGNYITKYPNHQKVPLTDSVALFWTMRDINALKRTKTFIRENVYNSIHVTKDKLSLYCYADVFKEYTSKIPYYFGNSDIMIDYDAFKKIENNFVYRSLSKYPFLSHLLPKRNNRYLDTAIIDSYFKNLLGVHYENK